MYNVGPTSKTFGLRCTNVSCLLDMVFNPATSQWTQNICITFVQCWTNVKDIRPTLYKRYTKFTFISWKEVKDDWKKVCFKCVARLHTWHWILWNEFSRIKLLNVKHFINWVYQTTLSICRASVGNSFSTLRYVQCWLGHGNICGNCNYFDKSWGDTYNLQCPL